MELLGLWEMLNKSYSKVGWCLGRTSWPAAENLHRQQHITEVAAVQGLVLKVQKLDRIRAQSYWDSGS